jgi:hypothetical protein
MGRMTSLERALLAEQLATLRRAFSPGLSTVNWNSLGIPDYAAAFRKARSCLLLCACASREALCACLQQQHAGTSCGQR